MAKPIRQPRIDPRFACFKLEIRKSKIHRFGVYALERIPKNRKVIEYTGQKLTNREADAREDTGYTYLFELDRKFTLDGAIGGSGAEIINHSCEPNLISRVMRGHILYMALRPIKVNEELTIDYNFEDTGEDHTKCSCGAKKCRGTIEKPDAKKKKKSVVKKAAEKKKTAKKR